MAPSVGRLVGINASFRVLTPLFLGGAAQEAELRVPSLKALLRFWHRAIDPGFGLQDAAGAPRRESVLWGGTERFAGQSRVLLAVTRQSIRFQNWRDIDLRRFDEGEGRRRKNGLRYLGYPFDLRGGNRSFIAPGSTFTLRATLRRGPETTETDLRSVAASLWLLGHLGSMGSRSRRGFGSLELANWKSFGNSTTGLQATLDSLPLLGGQSEREGWLRGLERALRTTTTWFGAYEGRDDEAWRHPHLGTDYRARLAARGFGAAQWPEALNALGRRLQDYRARSEPDYSIAKEHLQAVGRAGGRYMQKVPGRVTFGLPLVFRFGSLTSRPSEMTLVPFENGVQKERQPSLLFAKLVALGGVVHPLFVRLSGDVPGMGGTTVGERRSSRGGLGADHHALDQFMDSLE